MWTRATPPAQALMIYVIEDNWHINGDVLITLSDEAFLVVSHGQVSLLSSKRGEALVGLYAEPKLFEEVGAELARQRTAAARERTSGDGSFKAFKITCPRSSVAPILPANAVRTPWRAKLTAAFVAPPPVSKTISSTSIFDPKAKHSPSPVENDASRIILIALLRKKTSRVAAPMSAICSRTRAGISA